MLRNIGKADVPQYRRSRCSANMGETYVPQMLRQYWKKQSFSKYREKQQELLMAQLRELVAQTGFV